MRIEVRAEVDSVQWNSLVCSLEGNIRHSYEWAQFQKAICNGTPIYIFAYDENNICIGLSLAFVNQTKVWPFASFTKTLQIDTLPLVKNNSEIFLKEMVIEIEKFLKHNGFVTINIDSFNALFSCKGLVDLKFEINHRIELTVDLSPKKEEIFKTFRESLGRQIKKAKNLGVKIIRCSSESDLLSLRKMQLLSSERQAHKGSSFVVPNDVIYKYIKELLLDYGLVELFIARLNEEVLAAYLFENFNKKQTIIYGGSSPKGKELFAGSLLLWEAINFFKDNCFRKFVLGGVPIDARLAIHPEHGLYNYKKSFGAQEEERFGGFKIISKEKYLLYKLWCKLRKH